MKKLLLLCASVMMMMGVNAQVWDFTKWSEGTVANMGADTENWGVITADTRFANKSTLDGVPLKANGEELAETKGLLFGSYSSKGYVATAANKIRCDYGFVASESNPEPSPTTFRLQFNGKEIYFKIPELKAGNRVIVTYMSANSSDITRQFTTFEDSNLKFVGSTFDDKEVSSPTEIHSYTYEALLDGDVALVSNNGLNIFKIEVSGSSSISTEISSSEVVSVEYFNVAGQKLSEQPAGISLCKKVLSNGTVKVEKVYNK